MKHSKGFSLIELMIVVVIAGIIAAIAIPQYSQYVIRGNRAAAQAFMLDVSNREKQYMLDARSYTNSFTTLGMTPPVDVSRNYTVTIAVVVGPPPSYTITAAPVAGSKQEGDGNLTLDDLGNKTHGAATTW